MEEAELGQTPSQRIDNLASAQEGEITMLFAQRANLVREKLEPMRDERREQYKDAISLMAKYIPNAVLVGGWALRLHLEKRGKPVPEMPVLDIDFIIDRKTYDKVRAALKHPDDEYLYDGELLSSLEDLDDKNNKFRRKGKKEPVPEIMGGGVRNFMKNPDTYMAIEVGRYQKHVDLQVDNPDELEITSVEVNGVKVKTLTPEELYIRRLHQARRVLENARKRAQEGEKSAALPEKIFQYLYLNGEIVNHSKMGRLWERRHQQKVGVCSTWTEETKQLIQELNQGIRAGIFTFEKIYH